MLVLGSRLLGTPVMSLQTGTRLAVAIRPLIDPANLKVVAYEVDGPLLTEKPSYLRIDDIREMSGIGMIIDSSDEFVGAEDIIKLKELNELGFLLVGMPVIDEHKHKLGKVEDYTIDSASFLIQQLNVKRGFIRAIADSGVLIHRTQIVEINDNSIIVKTTAKPALEPVLKARRNDYVNPFRTTAPQSERE